MKGDPPDGWLHETVEYRTARWALIFSAARVTWVGASGIRWTAHVAPRADTLTPGAYRVAAEVPADADGVGTLPAFALRDGVELAAIAEASLLTFPGQSVPLRDMGYGLRRQCDVLGRNWRHYLRRVMASEARGEVVERAGRPDYRQVAEVYLEAVQDGVRPATLIRSRMEGCYSDALARKWVQRAAEQGWLCEPAGGSTRGAREAGRRLLEAGRGH